PLGDVVAEVRGDEGLVLEHVLDDGAHLLATLWAGIGFENRATRRRELLEGIGHGGILLRHASPAEGDAARGGLRARRAVLCERARPCYPERAARRGRRRTTTWRCHSWRIWASG